jgi:autotransporter-associated beta strand protein
MTDRLDRGLVAVKTSSGIWCSWRVLAEEYYDVKYNIYRDGTKLNDQPLEVTNFGDSADGTENSQYTVTAVVNGVETGHSKPATVWTHNYLEITPDHGDLKSTYIPNDACCADVDGDGEVEILMKYDNQSEINASYPKGGYQGEYSIAEVFKLDGTKLWWLDFGPNMGDFQNNEQNIVAYDWDGDGRAEALIRAADGTTIHAANGETYVIGDASKNYRGATGGGSNWFMHQGAEYLVYMDGATGVPYQVMDYPLKRLEAGETDLEKAWGDGYGHRSTKHFFGAPCLDGRKASIFLARGIYTRHKMIAFDVDPATHQLTERWRWVNNTPGSPWYGQGYHNYSIADVDWDGRDEICFGSMVIDDNGYGLSTTGLGHGDAHHVGDFNPYIHGQELFACNEDNPSNNYRDATTSKIYYRRAGGDDDGRCMAGNFTNDYPGAMAFSAHDEPISCVTADHVSGLTKTGVTDNFRIYWDGDLLEETLNYTSQGKNTAVTIYKYGRSSALQTLTGSMTNNDTKGTPCYQGDILGDWREEVIARTKDNKVRIYTTTIPTEWRNYSLWYDHQYRNAMVWQMCGYNQPPHVSYFLGELEDITVAPPPLTMTGRQEVSNGGTINSQSAVITCEPNDMTVSVAEGAAPDIYIDNAPSWVQGHDNNNNITSEYFTHTLTGGAFTGKMRLVKQGDGTLVLPKVTETYSGPTDVWAGTLRFDGTMENSKVWLNRFAVLESDGGKFQKGIRMDYGSELRPGGKDKTGSFEAGEIWMGFGSRIVFDVMGDGSADHLKTSVLKIEKKDWQNGPKYSAPVFEVKTTGMLEGKYLLVDAGQIEGSLDDIVLEGVDGLKASLIQEDGKIYLNVDPMRAAASVVWNGGEDGIWDLANTENFLLADGKKDFFVTGDMVTFGDDATLTDVVVSGDVSPSEVIFENETKEYRLKGDGSIIGDARLTKRGAGRVTISNTNKMTGGVAIEGGMLSVATLANTDGTEYGALGGVDNPITLSHGGTLAVTNTAVASQKLSLGEGGGAVFVSSGRTLTVNGAISQTVKSRLEKNGGGTMAIGGTVKLDTLVVGQGVLQGGENSSSAHQYPTVIVLNGGTLKDPDNIYSYSSNKATVIVPEGKTAVWTLDARCDYKGKLLGGGTLTVNVTSVRSNMQGDWSQFTGTLKFAKTKTGSYDPLIQWNNNYGLGKATVTGEFDNGGKDVTIGTLSDKATLTGSGRYTVKHIDATITRSRSGLSSTYFEVQGTLAISGDITVTLRGNELKAADRVTLWKAGALQTTSNVVVNLPDLPDGLYWDTSELLKKEGVLKVTDKPTAIDNGQLIIDNYDGAWFTLDGRRLQDKPTQKGLYIRNGKKVIVK